MPGAGVEVRPNPANDWSIRITVIGSEYGGRRGVKEERRGNAPEKVLPWYGDNPGKAVEVRRKETFQNLTALVGRLYDCITVSVL